MEAPTPLSSLHKRRDRETESSDEDIPEDRAEHDRSHILAARDSITPSQTKKKKKSIDPKPFSLHARAAQRNDRVQALLATPIAITPSIEEDEDEFEKKGPLWTSLQSDLTKWNDLTNFSRDEVISLARLIQPYIDAARARGPAPSVGAFDGLTMLLVMYKLAHLGGRFKELASEFGTSASTLESTIKRIRGALYLALKERWWDDRLRPKPLENSQHNHIALLGDSTSFEVFRPKGRFEEAKRYWDGKNKIYALKKEVAVSANKPHYALFSHRAQPGSVHDFEMLKTNYTSYIDYLLKTPDERASLGVLDVHLSWAILMDRGYVGPPESTPRLHRITVMKAAHTVQERKLNDEYTKIRVPVEQFFGRLKSLWDIAHSVFKYDHSCFDETIDVCILLTNEHIKSRQLEDVDYKFYKIVLQTWVENHEQKVAKQKKAREHYAEVERTRTALANVTNLRSPSSSPSLFPLY